MAKKKEVEQQIEISEENQLEAPASPTYDKYAYASFSKDDQYHLIEIPFNSVTLEAGKGVILESNDDEFEIEYALDEAISNMIYD